MTCIHKYIENTSFIQTVPYHSKNKFMNPSELPGVKSTPLGVHMRTTSRVLKVELELIRYLSGYLSDDCLIIEDTWW